MVTEEREIYLIGDSHVGLSDGDERPFVEWIGRLRRHRPAALYLNGDVFHYLIGDRKFITRSVENFFDAIRSLRDDGTEVVYVEGNRDFFLHGSIAEKSVSRITVRAEVAVGPRRYLVVHGDMINERDWPYRFWRLASKNPITRLGVGLIPGPIARRFVDNVEKKLARSNFKHKTRLPIEMMKRYGEAQGKKGFDAVVFGHFHHKTLLEAGKTTVTVLPAWYLEGEAMVISPTTGEFRFEKI